MKTIFYFSGNFSGFMGKLWIPLLLVLISLKSFSALPENPFPVVAEADLAVSNFTFSPQTIVAGAHPDIVKFRLTNNGPADLSLTNTLLDGLYYLSRNTVFGDADDILIGVNNYTFTLGSGASYNVDLSPVGLSGITIPESALGSYNVFVRIRHNSSSALTDPVPGNDYLMRSGAITVISYDADITVSSFTFSPQTININNSPEAVSFRLTNNGPTDLFSPNTKVKADFFLSRNITFGDADDIGIGINAFDFTLASGQSASVTLSAAQLSEIVIPGNVSGIYNLFLRVRHDSLSALTDPAPGNNYTLLSGGIQVLNNKADLTVSNFAFFPQTMNSLASPDSVSFILTNNGPANLTDPDTRVDALFYISRNNIFGDSDDTQLGVYSSDFTMGSGFQTKVVLSASVRSGIKIPANASGNYYVFVRVRHNSSSALTDPVPGNDYTPGAGLISVINSSADIAASNFSFLPDTMNAGAHPGTVTFRLTNNGPAELYTPNTRVDAVFYLSRNSMQGDTDDFPIGSMSSDYTLPAGSYFDIALSAEGKSGITIPADASGKYFVFVKVRHNSSSLLTDTNADNNFGRRLGTITVINHYADIAASNLAFLPETIEAGAGPTDVLFRLTNNGPSDLSSPDTRVTSMLYISRNNIAGDSDDIQIGMNSAEFTLAAGAHTDITYSAAEKSNVKIPAGASGIYNIFVRVQHAAPSSLIDTLPANNYAVKIGTIKVNNKYADLGVANFSFTPASIQAGAHPDTVSFRLINNGPADLSAPNTRVSSVVYISRNNTYGDADDIQVGINSHDFTTASGSFTDVVLTAAARSNITIPATATGNYYVFVRVHHASPSILTDTISTNNFVIRTGSIQVKNTSADLAVSNFVFLPGIINSGSHPDSISFRLTNNGPVDLASPNTRVDGVFYISANNILGDADDLLIGTDNFDFTLASGTSVTVTSSAVGRTGITIPSTTPGNYFVFVKVMHKTPSLLTDPVAGNDFTMRLGTIQVLPPCNLTIVPGSLNFSFSADIGVLHITSGFDWIASDDAEWISLSPVSGSGNGTVTVTVTENAGITRVGKITISGCGKTFQISVQQNELSVLGIKKIQGEGAYSPYVGAYQRIIGTVTAVVSGSGYYVQDAVAAWSGIWVEDKVNIPMEGNGIRVDGTVKEMNDVTTLIASKVLLMNPPVTITPLQMSSPEAAKSEQYESVLVKISGARFQGSLNLDGSWPVKTTELNRIFVNKSMYEYSPVEGHFYNVTGIVNGYMSDFRLEPRKAADIVDLNNTTPVTSIRERDITVYPNPFSDHLKIENNGHLTRLTMTDMTGRIQLDVRYPAGVIRTAHLAQGIYMIRLYTGSGNISAGKFIKK